MTKLTGVKMAYRKLAIIFSFFLLGSIPTCLCGALPDPIGPPKLRVAIGLDQSEVSLGGPNGIEIIDGATGETLLDEAGPELHQIRSTQSLLIVRGLHGSLVDANSRRYRGQIEIRPNQNGKLDVINVLDIEDYLYGVMKPEISPNWPREAVKVQAVTARTFALYQKMKNQGKDWDLSATALSQVYGGFYSEDPMSNECVDQTRGVIITYQDKPILAQYHAACGGRTENAKNVWGVELPYLQSISCPFCKDSPHYRWTARVSLREIAQSLNKGGLNVGKIYSIQSLAKSGSGRITELKIVQSRGNEIISGNEFRLLLGPQKIRSTLFTMRMAGGDVIFDGRGWGHGAGMCQWGAKKLAEDGYDYKHILRYYFKDVKIEKLK